MYSEALSGRKLAIMAVYRSIAVCLIIVQIIDSTHSQCFGESCSQYRFGGTTNLHFYTCCDNCGEDDESCDGVTYQGGGSTDDYCGGCGVQLGGGSCYNNFNCGNCGIQTSCEDYCSEAWTIRGLAKYIPGLCGLWSRCFRKCCENINTFKRDVNDSSNIVIEPFCGDLICQDGENCPDDCCSPGYNCKL